MKRQTARYLQTCMIVTIYFIHLTSKWYMMHLEMCTSFQKMLCAFMNTCMSQTEVSSMWNKPQHNMSHSHDTYKYNTQYYNTQYYNTHYTVQSFSYHSPYSYLFHTLTHSYMLFVHNSAVIKFYLLHCPHHAENVIFL